MDAIAGKTKMTGFKVIAKLPNPIAHLTYFKATMKLIAITNEGVYLISKDGYVEKIEPK